MEHYYKFKFYINAKHSVDFGGGQSNIHPHTWEVVLYIKVNANITINFTEFENTLENYFDKFEGKYLNEMEEFKGKNPTMENMGARFLEGISVHVKEHDLTLDRLEISENPTRTYIIQY